MTEQQEHEGIKALKDIAYELKRIADAIYEEREKEREQGTPLDHQPPVRN